MGTWEDVITAIGRAQQGDEGGREALLRHWEATPADDHARRCVLAHYLADLEPDLSDEVRWDETALDEHALLHDADLASIGIPSARGMAPSLHLNLADGYLRQGRLDEARRHLHAGVEASDSLAGDGYGDLVRRGLASLAARLHE